MKKICFITASRSEYGLLKWIMQGVSDSDKFEFQLLVTGGHLLKEQGFTIEQIQEDGFKIDIAIDCGLDVTNGFTIAGSMGRLAEKTADALNELKPDYIVVLGDRYELLPICSTAYIMRIPIIHISGGDVTSDVMDNGTRNAITMLSRYHFPGTLDSAENIKRMRESSENVWVVGEPGIDAFYREELLSRDELSQLLGISSSDKWVLFTYHPESERSLEDNLKAVMNGLSILEKMEGYHTVITYANADEGGKEINEKLEEFVANNKSKFTLIKSLGHLKYLSFMKQAAFVMGNSSSGIVEAPFMKCPSINIGDRQTGRHLCESVIQCGYTLKDIEIAVNKVEKGEVSFGDNDYWGDGRTSERIIRIIEDNLC